MANSPQMNPEDAGVDRTTTPAGIGESPWVMNAINRLDERLEQRYEALDERLRSIEKAISSFKGWLAAAVLFLVLLQVFLRVFDVSIIPK